MYAIICAIKKFHQYLYGNKFTLITDHRPLTQIFAKSNSLPIFSALRMQPYAVLLRAYDYDIVYKKSENNSNADCLSRLLIQNENVNIDVEDNYYINTLKNLLVTEKEIR